MSTTPAAAEAPGRILVVGRSPGVLVAAVDILRAKGYEANATNQFDQVLDDYDVTDLDVMVFGGMVPAETKQHLREEVSKRNPRVDFIQGLAGIPGVIAAQVEAGTSDGRRGQDGARIAYDVDRRRVQVTLREPAHVTADAFWHTSFTPPEPKSTSARVLDDSLDAGPHEIQLPDEVPSEASFLAVAAGDQVRVFTVGEMPKAVRRSVPTSTSDKRITEADPVTTRSDDH
ncbi:hypothetical protein [Actinacidiphila paucisporea]|uniref:Uncharacterized protein n=1 Tax=Actinacidiphila paucisporea TaxID=310782 RepID=A0A1M7NFT4_9ACTN|nr:hypothetical protein [Actinacidiphila paucisporea]SHN02589.1 hypothetical protein SAMN05216499_118118 [Actinacidiphila paucisporea]